MPAMEYYGTLGPACASVDCLAEMFEAGMTGMRLNLSHVTLKGASAQLAAFHEAAGRVGVAAKLLVDLQGPELRVGSMEMPVELTEGSPIMLGQGGIPVPALLLPYLEPGQTALLDDGKLLLTVTENRGASVCARVERGGTLRGRKSIALPGVRGLRPPALTEADMENIRCAAEYGVTGVMQPFVRDRADLLAVRQALDANGGRQIRLFAKIENLDGVGQLDELLPACDEIVIARGDLGNAVPLWELPALQKRIAARCCAAGKPFMVVTQMLASMENSPVPTRAEVSDIFNAVVDGASSVMVTGETAVGHYPAETIRYLVKTAEAAEQWLRSREKADED